MIPLTQRDYRILSVLLSYPSDELLEALPSIRAVLADAHPAMQQITALIDFLAQHSLIELQENYVALFDRNPSHSLHLFEHIHGESRDRGQAMVDLLNEYQRYGYEPVVSELPDHVPLFLEFLSTLEPQHATELVHDAISILASLGQRLQRSMSPYATLLQVLSDLSEVAPQEFVTPPVRDMEEAMERFGPDLSGVEPLLNKTSATGQQPIHFYPQHGAGKTHKEQNVLE